MDLYLVQHGVALPKEEDAARPRSDCGRFEVTAVARRAAEFGEAACVEGSPPSGAASASGDSSRAGLPRDGTRMPTSLSQPWMPCRESASAFKNIV